MFETNIKTLEKTRFNELATGNKTLHILCSKFFHNIVKSSPSCCFDISDTVEVTIMFRYNSLDTIMIIFLYCTQNQETLLSVAGGFYPSNV